MIAFALVAAAAAIPAPQSVQQPSGIVPAPARFNPEQQQQRASAGSPEESKDLQGAASYGYGYYGGGGYPYGGYGYSSFYGGYPGYGGYGGGAGKNLDKRVLTLSLSKE